MALQLAERKTIWKKIFKQIYDADALLIPIKRLIR